MASEFRAGESEILYSNKRWCATETLMDTKQGSQRWLEIKSHAPAVVVVPVNAEGLIGVIAQTRRNTKGEMVRVWELPSGWMETDTIDVTPEQICEDANRELQEELGFRAKKLEILKRTKPGNPIQIPFHIVLATELEKSKLEGDELEQLETDWLTFDEAEQRLLVEQQEPTGQVISALTFYRMSLRKE